MNSRMAAVDDRGWMYLENHVCNEYLNGLDVFIAAAVEDMKRTKKKVMYCPCSDCENKKKFSHHRHLHGHIILCGFKERYNLE